MITPESTSFYDSLYFSIDKPVLFFDLEATDKDVATARITQISILKINHNPSKNGDRPAVQQYTSYFNPMTPVTPEAQAITGLTNEFLNDKPLFADEASIILSLFSDAVIGGHNIMIFDLPLLMEELLRAGRDLPKNIQIIDTYRMFEKILPRTLASTYKHFVGEDLDTTKAHDAEFDTLASMHIFSRMCLAHQSGEPVIGNTPEQWDKISRRDKVMVDFAGKLKVGDDNIIRWAFGKHEGRPVSYDASYVQWVRQQSFITQDTKRWISHALINNDLFRDTSVQTTTPAAAVDTNDLPI